MTLTYHSADETENSGSTENLSITKPTNITEGDLIIVIIQIRNRRTITPDTGFSLIEYQADDSALDRPTTAAYYKVATDSEDNYSFTLNGSSDWRSYAVRISSDSGLVEVDESDGDYDSDTSATNLQLPAITASDSGILIVAFSMRTSTSNHTQPSGMTMEWTNEPTGISNFGAREDINSGSTGSKTGSWTTGARVSGVIFNIIENLGELAQSTSIDLNNGIITKATMSIDLSSGNLNTLNLYLTADGGSNWEEVTNETEHTFTNTGQDLRWKIEGASATITKIEITDYH